MAPRLDGRVTKVCFDYAVTLCTESGFEVRLETTFAVAEPNDAMVTIEPEAAGPEASRVLTLLHRVIDSAEIEPSGRITVDFVDGSKLVAHPHPEFEAWAINGPRQERVICLPGGGISEWSPTE